MFLENVLSDVNFRLVLDKYDKEYLESLDPYKFAGIYNIFINRKFYFIEDLMVKYLEMFTLSEDIVEDAIANLEDEYGSDYIYHIGKNLSILDDAICEEMERLV
jgi:hypothetical protein